MGLQLYQNPQPYLNSCLVGCKFSVPLSFLFSCSFFLTKIHIFQLFCFYAGSGAPAAIITILLPELTVILPVPVATLICSDTTDP